MNNDAPLECPHLKNDECLVARLLANRVHDSPASKYTCTPEQCVRCEAAESPRSPNMMTLGIAVMSLHTAKETSAAARLLREFREFVPKLPRPAANLVALEAAGIRGESTGFTGPAPCAHRGQRKDDVECASCTGSVRLKTFDCSHESVLEKQCTLVRPVSGFACCEACSFRTAPTPTGHWEWITTQRLAEDAKLLAGMLPPDIDGVAGIPRSGMLPAAVIAMERNLPLFEISRQHGLKPLGGGGRAGYNPIPHRIAVIDDSVYAGYAFQSLTKAIPRNAVRAAVYVRPDRAATVDMWAKLLPTPHLFEWHIFNSGLIEGNAADPGLRGGVAADFDGVLCENCPIAESDSSADREKYLEWIANAKPLHLPRLHEIPLVVTFRYHWAEQATRQWLTKWGARVREIRFSAADSYSARSKMFDVAEHKGKAFRDSRHSLFIESHAWQAKIIAAVAKKPCVGLDTAEIFHD